MEQEYFESLYPDTARLEDISRLAEYIKKGSSAQVISIPGVGRSTVFALLAHNKKLRIKHFGEEHLNIHFVPVNFSEIRNRSLFDATKFMFLSLSDSLRERGLKEDYERINKYFKEGLSFKDELVLFQKLKEAVDYVCLEKKIKLVFLFDRFEEYVPAVTSEFFANLRSLRSRAKYSFLVIFSLNRPLEDLLEPLTISDFYEFVAGNHLFLSLYDKATTDFRVSYIEKVTAKKLEEEIRDEILRQTGGVGKLVKLSAEAMLSVESMNDAREIGDYLFSKKSIQEALSEICRSLTPSEQTALIKQKYEEKDAISYLKGVGVMVDRGIQIPIFEQHIRMHRKDPAGTDRKIVFDQSTNAIKKGELILSDQLTGSEFRLLHFFLQNEERVLTRDEIIGAVWSDVKSTAGITDQAVDQLIFRLRRKIEEEPNSPAHLLTVKGRGFRFMS
jgi:hypothetical protein